jgi:hypothetical protein
VQEANHRLHRTGKEKDMKLVVIESPYGKNPDGSVASKETIERNTRYVRACIHDCVVNRRESPYASHALLVLPGVLDDAIPEERKLGMAAGLAWQVVCDDVVMYCDLGITPGMEAGADNARRLGKLVLTRYLGGIWQDKWCLRCCSENIHALKAGVVAACNDCGAEFPLQRGAIG